MKPVLEENEMPGGNSVTLSTIPIRLSMAGLFFQMIGHIDDDAL
jgi:hypothetical protein